MAAKKPKTKNKRAVPMQGGPASSAAANRKALSPKMRKTGGHAEARQRQMLAKKKVVRRRG